jgi:cytochrome c peroxidase
VSAAWIPTVRERPSLALFGAFGVIVTAGCSQQTPHEWQLPPGFPEPSVPVDNPLTEEKIELGRHLFYDERLSANGTQSCASCHEQEHAFS